MPDKTKIRMLIVDDEAAQMKALCDTLRDHGYETIGFNSAKAALNALQTAKFDLLLSDIGMPEMDGYAFINRVRALNSPMSRIPAIAVTAYARAEDRQRSLLAGYQMHISKPLETPELIAAIASLLKVWRD